MPGSHPPHDGCMKSDLSWWEFCARENEDRRQGSCTREASRNLSLSSLELIKIGICEQVDRPMIFKTGRMNSVS